MNDRLPTGYRQSDTETELVVFICFILIFVFLSFGGSFGIIYFFTLIGLFILQESSKPLEINQNKEIFARKSTRRTAGSAP